MKLLYVENKVKWILGLLMWVFHDLNVSLSSNRLLYMACIEACACMWLLYFIKPTIREMNKKLYDSNDGLRSALASEVVAAKRRVSPLFLPNYMGLIHNQILVNGIYLSFLPDRPNLLDSCLPKTKSQPEGWSPSGRAHSTTAGTALWLWIDSVN